MSKIVLFGLSRLISRQQFRTVHMGSWLSWESAAFATRRSRVRSPSGPPFKNPERELRVRDFLLFPKNRPNRDGQFFGNRFARG